MTALEYDALWNKGKVFIDRALVARDDGRTDEYHLWAAVALELLGKASLARVHPSLVADPTHFPSMLAAVGHQQAADVKSVTARTLFSRLGSVVPGFDDRMQRECNTIAERRNAELHSGESPLTGISERAWVPFYWRVVNVLLAQQGRTFEELVGDEEAPRIREILRSAAELTRQTVLARIARRAAAISERYPADGREIREAIRRAAARPLPTKYQGDADAFEEVGCPACNMKGWLFGAVEHEEIREVEVDADPEWGPMMAEILEVTYSSERFLCSECGLTLDGHEELRFAGLPSEFVQEEEHEPDYEPEYGND
ncbi:MAG TPA: hypothetical protein VHG93_29195 [Longimicrobium sp.]|nr:hypothetical protein [Longimicrobium sp.]